MLWILYALPQFLALFCQAFANLIAAIIVTPPLGMGIFGSNLGHTAKHATALQVGGVGMDLVHLWVGKPWLHFNSNYGLFGSPWVPKCLMLQ